MQSEPGFTDFETSIGPWLGKTVKMLEYYLQRAFQKADLDLTKEQMIILKKLHIEDGLNQNELAAQIYRDKSSLTRLLSKMESKGYVMRKQSGTDKRINEIFLTNKGKTIFIDCKPAVNNLLHIMEQDLTEQEKSQLINTLKKVQHNFSIKTELL